MGETAPGSRPPSFCCGRRGCSADIKVLVGKLAPAMARADRACASALRWS
eukprot:COSAG06_NODE_43014_length_376_cov_0.740072_1_plen_49_part_10